MNAPRSTRSTHTREQFAALDAADRLAPLRQLFELPAEVIYLDGNSLGALPKATPDRVQRTVRDEWGRGLITSWNHAGWIDLPRRLGDKIARLVGAAPGELVVADSTSINLFKVLWAALSLQQRRSPQRRVIVSERSNFPTDLYIAQSIAAAHRCELRLVDAEQLNAALDDTVAALMLTHVNYRTGHMHDMAALTSAAHACGALTVWDLAHSAGAVPVDLNGAQADFAIGCGYKYLNGGPGAPAFVWVHARHAPQFEQPLTGWMGHAAPFEFGPDYRAAAGITRALCGTPPVLSMAALECGIDTLLAAEPYGGMRALRDKSLALTRSLHRAGRRALRGPRLRRGVAAGGCATRQPGLPHARRRRPRHRAGADQSRRDRRLPRRRPRPARHPALRLHAADAALRRRVGRGGASAPGDA